MRLLPNPKKAKNKLLREFKDKRILELGHIDKHKKKDSLRINPGHFGAKHDLKFFPWPIEDNSYDLIICQHVMHHLPETARTLEEFNRITAPGGKIFIEMPHYTWFESYRHMEPTHRFSFGSFDYFLKGNTQYNTEFHIEDKKLFFDDLTYLIGVGFLANAFPRLYEKRLAFMFPATSFQVTFRVDK